MRRRIPRMRALQCRGKAFSQPKPGELLLQWHSSCFTLASCLDFPQRKVMETLTVASAVRPNRIAVLTDGWLTIRTVEDAPGLACWTNFTPTSILESHTQPTLPPPRPSPPDTVPHFPTYLTQPQ